MHRAKCHVARQRPGATVSPVMRRHTQMSGDPKQEDICDWLVEPVTYRNSTGQVRGTYGNMGALKAATLLTNPV